MTPGYFETLGIEPFMGRTFCPEDGEAGVRVAILSHALWQSRYGADPDIVGAHRDREPGKSRDHRVSCPRPTSPS